MRSSSLTLTLTTLMTLTCIHLSFARDARYWLGLSSIAIRGNPFGSPGGAPRVGDPPRRAAMVNDDPRRSGCFGAAWFAGLASQVLDKGLTCVGLGDMVGDRGHTSLEVAPPDDLAPLWAQAMYHTSRHGRQRAGTVKYHPAFHVVRAIARACGAVVWDVRSTDTTRVRALGW